MTTTLDIITRAYRKAAVSQEGDALDADQLAEGLDSLNMMLAGWKLDSVDIEHTTLSPPDDFPLPAEFEEGTVYNLAARINPNYQAPPQFDADDWFRKIQAAYTTVNAATFDNALLYPPSRRHRYSPI